MTAEETISILKIAIAEVEWNYPMDYAVAIETAIQALEKQIPKKIMAVNDPCHVKALDSESAMIYTYSCIHCPNCSKWIVANTNHRYCEHCGQALDWRNGNATN